MADKIFHSTAVTFVDMTDSRILDVYISSNHPTVQLCNVNKTPLEYTPNWSVTNLELKASFYLDSNEITPDTIEWYTKIESTETTVGNTTTLHVTSNVLGSNAIITYGCRATYQNLEAFKEITFTRVDTGLNGSDGSSAPAVQAQYSTDGSTGWTSTLNAATHKYIRHSYDGGKTWTAAIKIVGEDGTSVNIKGTATSKKQISGTSYWELVYNSATITGAVIGDAYLLDGNLYVCVDSRDGNDYFMDVGHIQGPQGNDGQSSYVFIRYATSASGANMTNSPNSATTYIGICTVNTNVAPTTASSYTWSKFVGDNAKSIILSGTSQIFKVSQDATPIYTPTTIKVTAQTVNTTVANWEYSVNGGISWTTIPAGVSLDESTNTLTITGKDLTSNSLVIRASNGIYKDIYTIYKVFDGVDGTPGNPGTPAPIAFLTNENISFSANASGQVALTSFTTNVVAYHGTTKVTPTIRTNADGTLAITGLPTGMTVDAPVTTSNEQILTFSIANNSTLGSTSSNNGTITIPIISPVSTNLILSWSKINSGATGVGIKSVTEYYLATASSSGVTTSTSGWTTAVQTITTDKKYLWNYEVITYTNNITSTTTPIIIGVFGNTGNTGKGIKSVTEYYLATSSSSGVTTATSGWTTTIQALTASKKYLWNYEVITYTDNTTTTITPVIIGVYGDKGVDAITFQIYAPNGYLLTNELESLKLETLAYDGSTAITSATYAWSYQANDEWVSLTDDTEDNLVLTKDDVIKSTTYRCAMTYKNNIYYATVTVQDKTDVYDVMICVSDNVNHMTGIYYWVVYALLYSEQGEADALLGPISTTAPLDPETGDYWYAVDSSAQTVTLKQYNGSTWVVSTDQQMYTYDWSHIVDGTQLHAIGNNDKVQIISCNSFTSSATFQCIVTDTDGSKLARCNLYLTDTSDPIVSPTAPTGVKDGQLWMQTQSDGTFLMYIWDSDTKTWKQLNADTKNVVHTKKPSSYKVGDLWVVESETAITGHIKGTLLQATATSTTFEATHWTPSLKYESEISDLQKTLKSYKQYMTVDTDGLHMQAKNSDGTLSPFQALFTNTRLSFLQDDLEVAYISDNKLNISEASIDNLSVDKKIQLQKFEWAIESNGSMSLRVNY